MPLFFKEALLSKPLVLALFISIKPLLSLTLVPEFENPVVPALFILIEPLFIKLAKTANPSVRVTLMSILPVVSFVIVPLTPVSRPLVLDFSILTLPSLLKLPDTTRPLKTLV